MAGPPGKVNDLFSSDAITGDNRPRTVTPELELDTKGLGLRLHVPYSPRFEGVRAYTLRWRRPLDKAFRQS